MNRKVLVFILLIVVASSFKYKVKTMGGGSTIDAPGEKAVVNERDGNSKLVSNVEVSRVRTEAKFPAEEREIRYLENLEEAAIVQKDTATLFVLWSPDYVRSSGVSNTEVMKKYLRDTGITHASFSRRIDKVTFSRDSAIVTGYETIIPRATGMNSGKTVTRKYANVWARSGDSWQLRSRQSLVTRIE